MGEGAEVAEQGDIAIRRRRWHRVPIVVAVLVTLVLLGLWLARKPIARGQIDRVLSKAGVPARYTLADLGLGRQRLTDVVIGDPANPDLVADWLETRTGWGVSGPHLDGVRGGRVRIRARWADGRLSLGSIDRLIPRGRSGQPFTLPALAIDIGDLGANVRTPWGPIAAHLAGAGRLDRDFAGRLTLTSGALDGGCRVDRPAAQLAIATTPSRVTARGPLTIAAIRCDGVAADTARATVDASVALGRERVWKGRTQLAVRAMRLPGVQATDLTGTIMAHGERSGAGGTATLAAARIAARDGAAQGVEASGDWRYANDALQLGSAGSMVKIAAAQVRLSDAALAPIAANAGAADGSPLAPLVRQWAAALVQSGRGFALTGTGRATVGPNAASVSVDRAALRTPAGATVALAPGADAGWSTGEGVRLRGTVSMAGGGLPEATALLRPDGGAMLSVQPYAAGGARLALTPVALVRESDGWRVTTDATLSGPVGDGRVDALALPVRARWRNGALTLDGGCTRVGWVRVAVSGLDLRPASLDLCAEPGQPLLRTDRAGLHGNVRIAAARLLGALGSTPVTLDAAGARLALAERSFALNGVEARFGAAPRQSHLSFGALNGVLANGALSGQFATAGGQIGAVPLALSGAVGTWRFAQGALSLDGALSVADTVAPARFQPMAGRAVTLRLAQGRIVAAGELHEPGTGTKVADVTLRHDLAAGTGAADLTVAGLIFTKAFQPELLTRVTFGIIADVRGTVAGEGHIGWTPAGVTSTGSFHTAGVDLAAAFGPVTGLAGTIRFTDLLNLQSAPGQRVTVKSINPGVPVTDGVVTFQTLQGTRVQVEGAHWPFAGGTLDLAPTLLDFSGAVQRRMTFHVQGAAADKFLLSFDFKNLDATGIFDGTLPMLFDSTGGRIEGGRLTARPGGGTIAYVGDVSQEKLGFWGNFAFDALKSLRYRALTIGMDGPLAGEMVTEVRFAGVSQGKGAKSNFLIRRLQRLPLVFNVRVKAPFRGLLDATASFYDPKKLIERNLPELLKRQKGEVIQPSASETKP